MHAAVELLYREGLKIKPQWPPLVGQIITSVHKGVPVAHLWPLEWVANAPDSYRPLAALWQPVMVRIGHGDMLMRGYEGVQSGPIRRWHVQTWLCNVMTAESARDYLKPLRYQGEIPASPGYGPYPAASDADAPFG